MVTERKGGLLREAVIVEGVRRLFDPPEVTPSIMVVFGVVGLLGHVGDEPFPEIRLHARGRGDDLGDFIRGQPAFDEFAAALAFHDEPQRVAIAGRHLGGEREQHRVRGIPGQDVETFAHHAGRHRGQLVEDGRRASLFPARTRGDVRLHQGHMRLRGAGAQPLDPRPLLDAPPGGDGASRLEHSKASPRSKRIVSVLERVGAIYL